MESIRRYPRLIYDAAVHRRHTYKHNSSERELAASYRLLLLPHAVQNNLREVLVGRRRLWLDLLLLGGVVVVDAVVVVGMAADEPVLSAVVDRLVAVRKLLPGQGIEVGCLILPGNTMLVGYFKWFVIFLVVVLLYGGVWGLF